MTFARGLRAILRPGTPMWFMIGEIRDLEEPRRSRYRRASPATWWLSTLPTPNTAAGAITRPAADMGIEPFLLSSRPDRGGWRSAWWRVAEPGRASSRFQGGEYERAPSSTCGRTSPSPTLYRPGRGRPPAAIAGRSGIYEADRGRWTPCAP